MGNEIVNNKNSSSSSKSIIPTIFQKSNLIVLESKEDKIKRLTLHSRKNLSEEPRKDLIKTEIDSENLITSAKELSSTLLSMKINCDFTNTLFNSTIVPDLNMYAHNNFSGNCYKSNIEALNRLHTDEESFFQCNKNLKKLFDLNNQNFSMEELDELDKLKIKCRNIDINEQNDTSKEISDAFSTKSRDKTKKESSDLDTKSQAKSRDKSAKSSRESRDKSAKSSREKSTYSQDKKKLSDTSRSKSKNKNLRENKSVDNIVDSKNKTFNKRKEYDKMHNKNNTNRKLVEEKLKNIDHSETFKTSSGENETQSNFNNNSKLDAHDSKSYYSTRSKIFLKKSKKTKVPTIVHKVDINKMIDYYKKKGNKSQKDVK